MSSISLLPSKATLLMIGFSTTRTITLLTLFDVYSRRKTVLWRKRDFKGVINSDRRHTDRLARIGGRRALFQLFHTPIANYGYLSNRRRFSLGHTDHGPWYRQQMELPALKPAAIPFPTFWFLANSYYYSCPRIARCIQTSLANNCS